MYHLPPSIQPEAGGVGGALAQIKKPGLRRQSGNRYLWLSPLLLPALSFPGEL